MPRDDERDDPRWDGSGTWATVTCESPDGTVWTSAAQMEAAVQVRGADPDVADLAAQTVRKSVPQILITKPKRS